MTRVNLTARQAAELGLAAAPARPRRKAGETEVTPDGHVVNLAYVGVLERELDAQLMDLAKRYGWYSAAKDTGTIDGLAFHAATPMTQQERGWPDRVLVRRRDRRLIFAELKKERGYPSPRQTVILDLLRCLEPRTDWEYDYATTADVVRIEVHLWRPSDILAIDAVLR